MYKPSGAVTVLLAAVARAQWYQQNNLTPDGFWHNRYHAMLSMAAYGDYNTTCPQTFTQESLMKNFPNATRPPWTVVSTFGPTVSGCAGFTAIIPEMNKALIIFRGDYALETSLPDDIVGWDDVGLAAEQPCPNCTVNRFAVQGYLECKEETNNWEAIREAYYGAGLVFSITGHGLGGMHSQIAAVDFYAQNIDYYNHAYGSPPVFNEAGAIYYNERFNGEAGERGVYNNDRVFEVIPEGKHYTHAGTPFYYHGWNESAQQPYWTVCWLTDFLTVNTTHCNPRVWNDTALTTSVQDHYHYFADVGTCTQTQDADVTVINAFVQNASLGGQAALGAIKKLESLGQSMATDILNSLSSASLAAQKTSTSAAQAGRTTTAPTNTPHDSGASSLLSKAGVVALMAACGAGMFLL